MRLSPDQAVWVRALARDIVLCSWARHFTLPVPLSNQVYKWVPANLMLGGYPAMDWHPIQGGVEILSVASGNRDNLRPGGPLGLYADLTLPYLDLLKDPWINVLNQWNWAVCDSLSIKLLLALNSKNLVERQCIKLKSCRIKNNFVSPLEFQHRHHVDFVKPANAYFCFRLTDK